MVEVGHAERRAMFGETDEIVARKTLAGLRNGLAPVLCIGEAEPGAPDHAAALCIEQLESALAPARSVGDGRTAAGGLRTGLGDRRSASPPRRSTSMRCAGRCARTSPVTSCSPTPR